jgi:hypothetical protein
MADAHLKKTMWFFLTIFSYVLLLGRIGMPLAHDFYDPLVMRDTCLVVPALLDRGASLITLLVEAMKHLEGPVQFVLMNSYCLLIRDTFPLTPTTMQFPNTVLAWATCLFAFLLIRRLFDLKLAYCTVTAFVLTPWIAQVIRLTQYFNMLSLLFHFSTAYFLLGLMMEPTSRFWRVMAPLSLAVYFWSSLDWPSYVLFLCLFCMFSRKWSEVVRNPYNALTIVALAPLLAWDILLYTKFGFHGLAYTRLLYPLAVSSKGAASATLSSIWANHVAGWGPLMAVSFGGLVYYLLSARSRLSSDSMARSFLDACGLWLVWATVMVLLVADHRTYLYVLGMPAAVLSGLAFSKIRTRALVAIVAALAVFQIGVVTDWGFGAKNDDRRRVLAAACFLMEYRPDLLAPDKTLLAVECRRGGEKGLGGAVAQYARPQKMPVVVTDHFPVTGWLGRGAGPGGTRAIATIIEEYNKHGKLNVDGVILESKVLSKQNPARKFWLRVVNDPNIRWLARFKEDAGEIFIGEVAPGNGASLEYAPLMDVKALSDRYLEKYDRFSYVKSNLGQARLYFTSILSEYGLRPSARAGENLHEEPVQGARCGARNRKH